MKRIFQYTGLFLIFSMFLASSSACNTSRTVKGAVIGGSAGGVIGGVIGKKSGNGTKGVIIGSVIGGSIGAVIGDYMDRQAREIEQIEGVSVERVGEGIVVTMENGVLFGFDSYALSEGSKAELDRLSDVLTDYDQTYILVDGYTDSSGAKNYNQRLSERRALAVADYLTLKGVGPSRIRTNGYGEDNPVVSNDTEYGRIQNRRVEIGIVGNEALREDAADGSLK